MDCNTYWEYTPFSPVCIGDFDGSGLVDGLDVGILLSNWGGDLDKFDLNGDDTVDGADIGILVSNWGPCDG